MFKKKDAEGKKPATPKVNVYKKTATKHLITQVLNLFLIAIAALFVLYIIFAATIIRVVPAGSGIGPIVVRNNTFYGGFIPENSVVLVNNAEEIDNSPLNNLKMSLPFLNDDVSIIQVKAGPVGKFSWTAPGVVSIDGKIIDGGLFPPLEDKSQFIRKYLENEYIGLCIEGNCVPGDLVIFGANNIMGIPVREADLEKAINEDINFFPNGPQSGMSATTNSTEFTGDCAIIDKTINGVQMETQDDIIKMGNNVNSLNVTDENILEEFDDYKFNLNSLVNFINENDINDFDSWSETEQNSYYTELNKLFENIQASGMVLQEVCSAN